ncbi:MAG: hypothetical protein IPJ12_12490 [Betaproteobacteria bacterium]|nr:hypothetical protein [Betaproteobacteria bacterium]
MEQVDNKYQPSDWRSLEMHRLIAKKLEANPSPGRTCPLKHFPLESLRGETPAYSEWEDISLFRERKYSARPDWRRPGKRQITVFYAFYRHSFWKRNARRSTLAGTEGNHSSLLRLANRAPVQLDHRCDMQIMPTHRKTGAHCPAIFT